MDAVGMKTLAFFLCFAFVHSRGCAPSNTTATPKPSNTTAAPEPSTTTAAPKPYENTYVGFVVDETGSMPKEIETIKKWIVGCVEDIGASCGYSPTGGWVVTAFRDPDVRRVVGPTTDINEIIAEVDLYDAFDGGDCPEMAFTGLRNAVNVIPANNTGCKIFLFTDATAKDEDQFEEVTNLYKEKGCNFIPILTGCCGLCPAVCDYVEPLYYNNHAIDHTRADRNCTAENDGSMTPTVQTQFYTMAEETGGNIYSTPKLGTIEELYQFLEEEVKQGFCGTTIIAGPEPMGYRCLEDCEFMKMCWDKGLSKCYCHSALLCIHTAIPQSRCVQDVQCDPDVELEIIQDYFDCSGYYQCSSGTHNHLKCAEGMIYSSANSSSICDIPSNVPPPCGTMET